MEKRLFSRVNVNNCICTLTKNGASAGLINNIGLGGLNVTTTMEVHVEDMVEISFSIPYFYMLTRIDTNSKAIINNHLYKPIVISTTISAVRIDNDGIAFRFGDLSPEDFWFLQSFVHNAILSDNPISAIM